MTAVRGGLPPMPVRMRHLPVDERGYPVPWFVAFIDGKPDFRVIRRDGFADAIVNGTCWLCGEKLGRFKAFVIGPMCAVNRVTSEPPCHRECAEFAALACPFLILPRAKRREANLPASTADPAGVFLKRNPGATCVWLTQQYRVFEAGERGYLIDVGDPSDVLWYSQGRQATRHEVIESIDSGMHHLWRQAQAEGRPVMVMLENYYARMQQYLPQDTVMERP